MFYGSSERPASHGQFDPLKLGELLASRGLNERQLFGVRIYRGLPNAERDPRGHAATRSQIAHWQQDPRVTVITRPLKYPPAKDARDQSPAEKGIDVQLAIDFATMAVRMEYDTGILLSRDTDLLPALEFVASADVRARCETASWRNGTKRHGRLTVGNFQPYCHWIEAQDFASIADDTNYASSKL